jgi:hypothetical protein
MVPGTVIDCTYGSYTESVQSNCLKPRKIGVYLLERPQITAAGFDTRAEVNNMTRTTSIGSADDWQKWLALAGALAALGILPKPWQKTIGAASALLWFVNRL